MSHKPPSKPTDEEKARATGLLRRRREGKLSPEEDEELASCIQADDVRSILRAKALVALKKAGRLDHELDD